MSLKNSFGTDSKKEVEGVEILLPANEDGSIPTFVISRMGKANKRYAKLLEVKMKPHRRSIDLGTMNEEVATGILREVFCEAVLKGWSNVLKSDVTGNTEDKGNCEFSKGNAIQLFENLPELEDYLQKQAQDVSLFREAGLEDDAKN